MYIYQHPQCLSLMLSSTKNIVQVAWINMDSCREALFKHIYQIPIACRNALQNCHYLHKSAHTFPWHLWFCCHHAEAFQLITAAPVSRSCSVTRCFAVDCGKTSALQSTWRPDRVQATEMSPLDDARAFKSHRACFLCARRCLALFS